VIEKRGRKNAKFGTVCDLRGTNHYQLVNADILSHFITV